MRDLGHLLFAARLAEVCLASLAVEKPSSDVHFKSALVARGSYSRGRIWAMILPLHVVPRVASCWHWGQKPRRKHNLGLRLGDVLDDGGGLSVVLSVRSHFIAAT